MTFWKSRIVSIYSFQEAESIRFRSPERLIKFINFGDQASETIENPRVFLGYQMSSADSVITKTSLDQDSGNQFCEVATIYEPICVTSASHGSNDNNPNKNTKIRKNQIPHKHIQSDQIKNKNDEDSHVLTKDIPCGMSASNLDLQIHPERMTNWIPLLEMAKTNISKLIDDHIVAIKNKAHLLESRQDDWLDKYRSLQAQKAAERRVCIQNVRDEINTKLENVNHLLDRLEKI